MLQQGRCGELSCGTFGPAARVVARPQDHGRAASAERQAKERPIEPWAKLRQPKTCGRPVGDHRYRHEGQRTDH